ncbi:aldo/keto reductase [Microbacterium sp. LWH11-1.2]|uniref:aldo/keto reductase n=1 Tax=unclassified Microbacterium TaxID=2609290 RepID=UPI0031393A9A
MKTRILGTAANGTDLPVSAVGIGLMGMSQWYGAPSSEQDAIRVILGGIDQGLTFLDTADVYGPFTNEIMLGKAIAGRRDDVVVATKFANTQTETGLVTDGSPANVHARADASLQRLGIDVIDLYYLHRVDPNVPIEDTVGAMSELVQEGKVRYIGLSEAAPATIRRAHKIHPLTAVQTEYSLFSRDVEDEILPTLDELGVSLVPYSPLGRGMLTATISSAEELDADDWRRANPRFLPGAFEANMRLVDVLRELARAHDVTAGQVALAWLLAQRDDLVPIPGTRRSKYLAENLGAADVELTAADLSAIAGVFVPSAVIGDRYPDMTGLNG